MEKMGDIAGADFIRNQLDTQIKLCQVDVMKVYNILYVYNIYILIHHYIIYILTILLQQKFSRLRH